MAKIEIKQVVTGGDQAAQELEKTSKAIVQTTSVTKTAEVETTKLITTKEKWLGAIKKLSHEIPGLGYALAALKNPIVAISAVIAIAINAFEKFQESIKRIQDAVGSGTIATNFQEISKILAGSKIDAKELADQIDRIRNRPATPQEAGAKAMADLDRNLNAEAASDEQAKAQALAGVDNPEDKAAIEAKFDARAKLRAQRRLGGTAAIAAAKESMAKQDFRIAQEQAPGEIEAFEAAKLKHQKAMELAAAHEVSPEAIALLDQKIKEGEEALDNPSLMSFLTFWPTMGTSGYKPYMDSLRAERENMIQANKNVGRLRAQATGEFNAAQQRYQRFQAGYAGAAENTRIFGDERAAAMATSEAMRPYNDPGSQAYNDLMAVQRRYEAQAIRLLENLEKRTANTNAVLKAQSQDAR